MKPMNFNCVNEMDVTIWDEKNKIKSSTRRIQRLGIEPTASAPIWGIANAPHRRSE